MRDLEGQRTVTEFGTGSWTTRVVTLTDGSIRWQRAPGRDNPGPPESVPPGFGDRARAASDQHVRFAVPFVADGADFTWEAPGRNSAAGLLLSDDDRAGQLHEVFGHLGRQLRALHSQHASDEPPGDYPQPQGHVRLTNWLESGRGSRAAAGWRVQLRTQLGADRWKKLCEFAHHMLHPRPTDATTVVHGWFALGSIVVADTPGAEPGAAVLSGPEAALSRPETDVANLVGELLELSKVAERASLDRPVFKALRDRFLAHYGPGWDRETVAIGAVVRIATHSHDFAAYVGWNPDLHNYIPMLADLLDSDGAAALPAE